MKLILSCEHGGNQIPLAYDKLFQKHETILKTHKGYDPGALDLFKFLRPLATYSKSNEISRLLIELNRSLHHPALFSECTKSLSKEQKQVLIKQYYLIYRSKITQQIENILDCNKSVFHLSIHTFTPVFKGVTRKCDIGILYDPAKELEKNIAKQLKTELKKRAPELNVRFNYPYKGVSDGFTKTLRKQFPEKYVGIELEINHKFAIQNQMGDDLKQMLYESVQEVLTQNIPKR